MKVPGLNRTFAAQLTMRLRKSSSRPTKKGCSPMMRSRGSIFSSFPNGADLFGDVDADRTPGNAASTADASRTAELVDPRGELVGHPLAIAPLGRSSDAASVNIRKVLCETGIPAAPALGVITANFAYILDGCTKACGTNHGAIGTRQTTTGHIVPPRVLEVLVEKLFDSRSIDAAHLLPGRGLHFCSSLLTVFLRGWNSHQFGEDLDSTIAARCD